MYIYRYLYKYDNLEILYLITHKQEIESGDIPDSTEFMDVIYTSERNRVKFQALYRKFMYFHAYSKD